ncbi:MAG: hypothetical protein CMG56_03565 [Candidatus Marinimicrobia bacterium]|nr:hypothetical protein [Candidatus Neomarinimicrobiota bacterium]|tara:strand:- start:897 stop:1103 length:207 start_codon:yes stop_codon:yes gene_type:complete
MREVSKQGSWGKGNTILVGTNIMFIKLSDDKIEEGKILDFIDMKCGQGWEIHGFDNREVILQRKTLGK